MVDTVDGAFETPGMTRDEVFRITCDNYAQCLPWAEDYGVIINVEPHGPYTNDPGLHASCSSTSIPSICAATSTPATPSSPATTRWST